MGGMSFNKTVAVFIVVLSSALFSYGQVVRDSTLGNMKGATLAGPNIQINADLGQQVGTNLFHSFNQFNIQNGQTATFNGPVGVQNILTRVTGGLPSTLDGTLRSTMNGANFFFVNPAGIIFGPNVQLDITGSFAATTADFLRLTDGGVFSAVQPNDDVLTTATPSRFGFSDPGAQITNLTLDGSGGNQPVLTVQTGKSVTLAGGNININNGRLEAPTGRVNVIAVRDGELGLDAADVDSAVDTAAVTAQGDVVIEQGSDIIVDGAPAGRIAAFGQDVSIVDSNFFAFNTGSGNGGGIEISAAAQLLIHNSQIRTMGAINPDLLSVTIDIDHAFISDLDVALINPKGNVIVLFSNVGGDGDNFKGTLTDSAFNRVEFGVAPFAGSFRPQDRLSDLSGLGTEGQWRLAIADFGPDDTGQLNAWALTFGNQVFNSMDVPVTIPDPPDPDPDPNVTEQAVFSTIQIPVLDIPTGRAGDVTLSAGGDLTITGNSIIFSRTAGSADAGAINLSATGDLSIFGNNHVVLNSASSRSGASGAMALTGTNLFITDAIMTSESDDSGAAGSITFNATDLIRIDNTIVSTSAFGTGDSATFEAHAPRMEIVRSDIRSGTASPFAAAGAAGEIKLLIDDHLIVRNASSISTTTFNNGAGGDIFVMAALLEILSESTIEATNNGAGDSGAIHITATDILIDGFGGTGLNTTAFGTGDAGSISVATKNLELRRIAGIKSESQNNNSGRAGDISIVADGTILLDARGGVIDPTFNFAARGEISSDTSGSADAGTINITTGELIVADSFAITTSSKGRGNAGSITINADHLTVNSLLNRNVQGVFSSEIRSITEDTFGDVAASGDVLINANLIDVLNGGQISARSETAGAAGTVTLNGNRVSVIGSAMTTKCVVVPSSIETLASGTGIGGDIFINSSIVHVFNGGRISAASAASDGGNINIAAPSLFFASFGEITANAFLNGGQITINPAAFIVLNNSIIDGRAGGQPVLVQIDPNAVFLNASSQILTDAAVLPPEIDIAGELVSLRPSLTASGDPLPSHCVEQMQDVSSFYIGGVGGLPLSLDGWLPSLWRQPERRSN